MGTTVGAIVEAFGESGAAGSEMAAPRLHHKMVVANRGVAGVSAGKIGAGEGSAIGAGLVVGDGGADVGAGGFVRLTGIGAGVVEDAATVNSTTASAEVRSFAAK